MCCIHYWKFQRRKLTVLHHTFSVMLFMSSCLKSNVAFESIRAGCILHLLQMHFRRKIYDVCVVDTMTLYMYTFWLLSKSWNCFTATVYSLHDHNFNQFFWLNWLRQSGTLVHIVLSDLFVRARFGSTIYTFILFFL